MGHTHTRVHQRKIQLPSIETEVFCPFYILLWCARALIIICFHFHTFFTFCDSFYYFHFCFGSVFVFSWIHFIISDTNIASIGIPGPVRIRFTGRRYPSNRSRSRHGTIKIELHFVVVFVAVHSHFNMRILSSDTNGNISVSLFQFNKNMCSLWIFVGGGHVCHTEKYKYITSIIFKYNFWCAISILLFTGNVAAMYRTTDAADASSSSTSTNADRLRTNSRRLATRPRRPARDRSSSDRSSRRRDDEGNVDYQLD